MHFPKVDAIPGEYGRCFVWSRTQPGKKWLVDLFEYCGNGKCDCPQFRFRCQSYLEQGSSPDCGLQCAHILAAKVLLADNVIKSLMASEKRKMK